MFNLTHSQYDIWNSQSFHPDSPLYNENIMVSIKGDLDADRLAHSWQQLVIANPVLRTRISIVDQKPVQSHDAIAPELALIDFTSFSDAQSRADQWMDEKSNTVLNLDNGTVNCALLKIASDEWIWFIQQHHIAVDAWSMSLIWNQLVKLYLSKNDKHTGNSEYNYTTHLASYSELALNGSHEQEAQHWTSRNSSKPMTLYGRNPEKTTAHSTRKLIEPAPEVLAAIDELLTISPYRSFNRQLGYYQIFLSVVIGWLRTVSNEKHISINMPSACRLTKDEKACIGYFIEMLPFSVELPDNCSYEDLYVLVQQESMRFIRNAKTGACQYKSGATPNVLFNYIIGNFDEFAGFEITVDWISTNQIEASQALRVHVVDWQTSGKPTIAIDFNHAWFNPQELMRATKHLENALTKFIHFPKLPLTAHSLISEHEKWKLVDTDVVYQRIEQSMRIVNDIFSVCHKQPDSIAIEQNTKSINYKELEQYSYIFARALTDKGVVPGDRVVLHLDRCWQLLPALLGTLAVGAIYVPIDRSNPKQRLRKIEQNAQPTVIISTRDSFSLFESEHLCVTVDELLASTGADITEQEKSRLINAVDDSAPAYILYTSGSTGEPKGVAVSHGALQHYCRWFKNEFADKALHFPLVTSISFDVTAIPMFVSFLSGGSLHVYPNNNLSDATSMLDMISNNIINCVVATPSQFALVTDQNIINSSISKLIVLGEDFKSDLANRLSKTFGDSAEIYNMYGPTEATITCFKQKFDSNVHTNKSIPIGLPTAGSQGMVLNEHGREQMQGVTGELFLSGPLLANGYWHNEEKTATAFVNRDVCPGLTLYKTGDLVRINEQDVMEYLGRNDTQIKRNGIRIELGEIVSAALRSPDIQNAASVMCSHEAGAANYAKETNHNEKLVLYYQSTEKINDQVLFSHLSQYLSESLMPDQMIWLQNMPLNVNGKIDYSALPAPEPVLYTVSKLNEQPATKLESLWVQVWKKHLKVSEVGLSDVFFRIGGNSLLAIKLISELNSYGYKYEPADIFKHQTIKLLSKLDRKSNETTEEKSETNKPFSSISSADLAKIRNLV